MVKGQLITKIKRVFVNGLSLTELNDVLNKAYLEFIRYPSVEVNVLGYRPIKVLVEGEVANPGLKTMSGSLSLQQNNQFDINPKVRRSTDIQINRFTDRSGINNYFPTVFDAIRQSGGITKYSDLSQIQIIRKESASAGSGLITTTLNFENVLLNDIAKYKNYDSDIKVKI